MFRFFYAHFFSCYKNLPFVTQFCPLLTKFVAFNTIYKIYR